MIVLNNRKDGNEKISKYFKGSEFICHCGNCPISIVSDDLLFRLDMLRNIFGEPLRISSGYRCWVHNASKEVGGKDQSRHLSGHGADILFPAKNKDLLIKLCGKMFEYSYCGPNFIHVNV